MNASAEQTIDRDLAACLFCGDARLEIAFTRKVFHDRHDAPYHLCTGCHSLQISRVTWLDEAYVGTGDDIDTGSVQRSFLTVMLVRALRQGAFLATGAGALDYGAGLGLLVRLLRDEGFNAWGFDKYRKMHEADAFQIKHDGYQGTLDILVLIEVLEHLVDPFGELSAFSTLLSDRGLILVRTGLYEHRIHGPDWWYLLPQWGGHINFASRRGLKALARRLGMTAVFLPAGYCLMARPRAFLHLRWMLAGFWFLVNVALARGIGLLNFRHAMADAAIVEAANLRRPGP